MTKLIEKYKKYFLQVHAKCDLGINSILCIQLTQCKTAHHTGTHRHDFKTHIDILMDQTQSLTKTMLSGSG